MNTKLHAICDSKGRPINFFIFAGQVSDYIAPRALLSSLPDAEWLLGDRDSDADWFRKVDLSRFDAAPLIAFTATKETNYGHGKNG